MTSVLVFAGFALVLGLGWALLRASDRRKAVAARSSGDQVLLDQSPVGALLLDPALRITWTNEAFCDLLGLIPSALIGRGFSEVVQQEMRDLVEDPEEVESGLLAAYAPAAKTSPFSFHLAAQKGGEERWIEHTCHVIQHEPFVGGRVAYFVDITPRKSAALDQSAQEIHDLDQILLNLARRSGSVEGYEASVLRDVAALAAGGLNPDRWELWSLAEDRTLWTLRHLEYATPRRKKDSTLKISVPQTGPYLRRLDKVRVQVTPDVEGDADGHLLLSHEGVQPEAASRLDVPVRIRGKVVGTFVLVHHTLRAWTPNETRFAASIGDRMSLLGEAGRAGTASSGAELQAPVAPPAAAASTVDGFIHLDEKLRFTFLNPVALRWLDERGLDGNTLVGRTLEESMKGMRDRSIIAEVRKAIRGGGPARIRRQLESDGPWLDLYVKPSASGVSVTIQNRARRREREAERSLRDSETHFRSVVESLREGLIITDLDDRIVYVNSRLADLTGHRPEDLDGKMAQKLLFDTENWEDADSRMTARREKKRTQYDAPLIDKEGRVLSVEVISTPLRDADGTVTGVVDAITAVGEKRMRSKQAGGAGESS